MKRLYFPFLEQDYHAAEEWLNMQAEKGLRLKKMFYRFARFEQTEEPVQYAVMLWNDRPKVAGTPWDQMKAYCELAASCGWEYITRVGAMFIFCAKRGEALLETDPVAETIQRRRFDKRQVQLPLAYFIMLCMPFTIWRPQINGSSFAFSSWEPLLASNLMLCLLLLGVVLLLVSVFMLMRLPNRLRETSEAIAGGTLKPPRGVNAAYRASLWLYAVMALCAMLLIGAIALDMAVHVSNVSLVAHVLACLCIYSLPHILTRYVRYRFRMTAIGIALGILFCVICYETMDSSENAPLPLQAQAPPVLSGLVDNPEHTGFAHWRSPLMEC